MDKAYTIRQAERKDVPLLLEFIRGIAKYEKLEDEVIATAETLEAEMFDRHRAEAVFAVVDGREVGFALYFFNFSTFIGHSGLYLEDLFVWPEYRGKGYGKALLLHLAAIAREKNCRRMEWTCLDWNQPSIDFYLSIGAKPMNDWTIYRLDPRTCGGEFNIKNNTASFADFPLRTASCPLESAPVDIEQE